jgi:hypothetical protein
MTAFRTDETGATVMLDREMRKLEAAALALMEADGYRYTGGYLFGETIPRAIHYVGLARICVDAWRRAK